MPNTFTSFGDAYNHVVNNAFINYDNVLICNDDIVFTPNTFSDLMKNIEKEELEIKTDFELSPEEKNEKLDQLNTIKNETNREMEKTNEELKEAGIPDPRNSDVKYESVSYNSTEANKEVEDVKKDLTDLAKMKKEADVVIEKKNDISDKKISSSSGKPKTLHSLTHGCETIAASTSLQSIFSPPRIIISLILSTI